MSKSPKSGGTCYTANGSVRFALPTHRLRSSVHTDLKSEALEHLAACHGELHTQRNPQWRNTARKQSRQFSAVLRQSSAITITRLPSRSAIVCTTERRKRTLLERGSLCESMADRLALWRPLAATSIYEWRSKKKGSKYHIIIGILVI